MQYLLFTVYSYKIEIIKDSAIIKHKNVCLPASVPWHEKECDSLFNILNSKLILFGNKYNPIEVDPPSSKLLFCWSFEFSTEERITCWNLLTRVNPLRAPLASFRCKTPKSAKRRGSSAKPLKRWDNISYKKDQLSQINSSSYTLLMKHINLKIVLNFLKKIKLVWFHLFSFEDCGTGFQN